MKAKYVRFNGFDYEVGDLIALAGGKDRQPNGTLVEPRRLLIVLYSDEMDCLVIEEISWPVAMRLCGPKVIEALKRAGLY